MAVNAVANRALAPDASKLLELEIQVIHIDLGCQTTSPLHDQPVQLLRAAPTHVPRTQWSAVCPRFCAEQCVLDTSPCSPALPQSSGQVRLSGARQARESSTPFHLRCGRAHVPPAAPAPASRLGAVLLQRRVVAVHEVALRAQHAHGRVAPHAELSHLLGMPRRLQSWRSMASKSAHTSSTLSCSSSASALQHVHLGPEFRYCVLWVLTSMPVWVPVLS